MECKNIFILAFQVMPQNIPITFSHKNKTYHATLEQVHGAGNNVWHLMCNNYYLGRLRLSGTMWCFDEKEFHDLADFFGDYLIAWYQ